ncbi:TPA: replication initiation factor domain-containing protein [Bacillus nitratireducens]|uniref:replication initiation factor domain-containing protein n=1 Tax=Bacteria TaxID=2 RepID=UPI000B7A834E|nr:replication initiation factor domain-containing protein [Escherichia coli]MCU5713517.1 replication initiation factor domain-containing protein [Bacillus cereus]OXK52899.1 hypothetical protein CDL36_28665 [Escherichia coli]
MTLLPFKISLDRMTVMGYLKDVREFREFVHKTSDIDLGGVMTVKEYTHKGHLFPQADGRGSAYVEVDMSEEGLTEDKRNRIRFEFNPKWMTAEAHGSEKTAATFAEVYMSLLKRIDVSHLSGFHVAMDYDTPLLDKYRVTDTKPNRVSNPYIKNGIVETYTFGARGSALQLCFYDKKRERKDKEGHDPYEDKESVHRFEVRFGRKQSVRRAIGEWDNYNPFDGVSLVDLQKDKMDFDTYCKIKTLLDEPQWLETMHRNTRTKYKKLMREFNADTVDLQEAWKQAKTPILAEIEALTGKTIEELSTIEEGV